MTDHEVNQPQQIRSFGWLGHRPDFRDVPFKPTLAYVQLPPVVDLRPQCPPRYDQGQLGSCTANAAGLAAEFAHRQHGLEDYVPSRLFIYWYERYLEGGTAQTKQDTGAYVRDGFKVMNKYGCPHESLWQYDISKFATKPPSKATTDGKKHLVSQYQAVNQTAYDLSAALAQNKLVAFGFSVYESFMSPQVAQTGMVPMPRQTERQVGGHAVCLVGYQAQRRIFICANSWGNWGDNGFFYMPWQYVLHPQLAADFWVCDVAS